MGIMQGIGTGSDDSLAAPSKTAGTVNHSQHPPQQDFQSTVSQASRNFIRVISLVLSLF